MTGSPSADHIVVVGGGQAGGRATARLRELGYAGKLTLVCGEDHLPYERPALSKEFLTAVTPTLPHVCPPSLYGDGDVAIHHAWASRLQCDDRCVVLSDGERLTYSKLILCLGAEPRRLGLPGEGLAGVQYLRTLADAVALREQLRPGKRVVVVGGGFIGLEAAASARVLGCEVTVVEAGPVLMARGVPALVARRFEAFHRARGVEVRTGVRPLAFGGGRALAELVLSDGATLAADVAVVGIGVAPVTDLAQAAGLEVDDGVVVDQACRTSAPDVFAAGDATRQFNPWADRSIRLESWQSAQDQGAAAAEAALGLEPRAPKPPWMWSDQFEHNLQVAGAPDLAGAFLARGDPEGVAFTLFQLDGGVLTAAITVNRPADMPAARKMIAARQTPDPARLADAGLRLRDLTVAS